MKTSEEQGVAIDKENAPSEKFHRVEESTDENGVTEDNKIKSSCLRTLNELNEKNFIIDLESGQIHPKKLTGPELLYQKFLKTQAKPKVNNDNKVCMMNILTMEDGTLGMKRVEVKLDKEIEVDHNRPGLSREQLKRNLRNQIVQKRLEIIKKKALKSEYEPDEKFNLSNENKEISNKTESDIDEDFDPEMEEESEQSSCSDSENAVKKKKKKLLSSDFIESEAVDDDTNESSDEESSESEEEIAEDQMHALAKKGRILKAFVDSDEEEQQNTINAMINLHKSPLNETQNEATPSHSLLDTNQENYKISSQDYFNSQGTDFTFNEPSISEEIVSTENNLKVLFNQESAAIDEEGMLDLCSGQFFTTPLPTCIDNPSSQDNLSNNSDFTSQVPEEVCNKLECIEQDDVQTSEKDAVNSSVNDKTAEIQTLKKEEPIVNVKKLLESTDDEADNEIEDSNELTKIKKKSKKQKRQRAKKLGFSDDEDDHQIDQSAEEHCGEEEDMEEERDEILIDYDSEENEIEVKMSKKDKLDEAKKYFENEAELSESEWGSADENEDGLDKYEIDLADNEQFDQVQLREEVGRIHARKVMDEDLKNIQKIQDLLFENEENDGIGRERKFRWKNQTEGFTLEDENARDVIDGDNELEDNENEALWRKMRHERETLVSESLKMAESDTLDAEILLVDQNSQTVTSTNTSLLVKKKFQIIKTSSSSFGTIINAEKRDSSFLIKTDQRKFSNSFLSKDERTLSKIASFMSNKDDEVTSFGMGGGNSMSFAHLDKPDESKKRKSEGSSNSEVPNTENKKRKIESRQFLLDKLS